MKSLELWGGLECTFNRVGDEYFDQCEKNGHNSRLTDFLLFNELGIKKIRYPCLWETVSPHSKNLRDWSRLDTKLDQIKKLGISPIVGFLHHGSGPVYTNLLDPEFPEMFAGYARDFSFRYNWIQEFTPINEILTTARFSCLYGHWYPHHKNDYSFLKAVFNQCKATVLAMREIKKNIPHVKLIQTEDIGRCQSTHELQYQSQFENERKWLAFDILSGELNPSHPLFHYVISCGITLDDINWSIENHCKPDVLGINHYQLSNRFLDHRLELYPVELHGGNGRQRYADVGVLDTGQAELPAPDEIILECWNRFKTPIAITEVHTRGHREEQMRWFYHMWIASKKAQDAGVNIIALTAWSLLGTYDWHNLCTTNEMFYEPGVFDLHSNDGPPRKTALVKLIKQLITDGTPNSPHLDSLGSWQTSRRILFAPAIGAHSTLTTEGRMLLIIGATGTLGQSFAKICRLRNIPFQLLSRKDVELSDFPRLSKVIEQYNPWAIINAAGYVKVDLAEQEKDLCFRDNVLGPINLAILCAQKNIRLMTFSSDQVFNGELVGPYNENQQVSPINAYGFSKAICEEKVMVINPETLIIRSSSFFGPWDNYNFVTQTINKIKNNDEIVVAHDCLMSPTYLPDLVHASLNLLTDGEYGIFHLTNKGEISWAGFAEMIAKKVQTQKNSDSRIIEKKMEDINFAKRPKNSCLISTKGYLLPTVENALERYFDQRRDI